MYSKKNGELVLSGLFLAIGIILPYVFHFFGSGLGQIFLPMHIPVLLGGFFLSPLYAFLLGFILPYLNSFISGMPPLFPTAITMSLELAAYGTVISLIYRRYKKIMLSLITAMLVGRIISGIVNYILFVLIMGKIFTLKVFMTASFIKPLPGIIVQLILIPVIVKYFKVKEVRIFNE